MTFDEIQKIVKILKILMDIDDVEVIKYVLESIIDDLESKHLNKEEDDQ